MNRRSKIEELAALLDGELEAGRAEQLYAELKDDPQLKMEYQRQRETKALLGQLPEFSAPDYLATRIMGDIAARRSEVKVWRWRTLAAALGGFAVCLLLVSGVLYYNRLPQGQQFAMQPVGDVGPDYSSRDLRVMDPFAAQPRGEYAFSPEWSELNVPVSTDDKLTGFLEFANKAHHYSKLVNDTEAAKPDLPSAILVLDGKVYILDEALEPSGEE
jgi:hypothetical protein